MTTSGLAALSPESTAPRSSSRKTRRPKSTISNARPACSTSAVATCPIDPVTAIRNM